MLSKRLDLKISEELKEKLTQEAWNRKISIGELVRIAIEKELENANYSNK